MIKQGDGQAESYARLRKDASIRFLAVDWDRPHMAPSGVTVHKIEPFGVRREPPEAINLHTKYGWTLDEPMDMVRGMMPHRSRDFDDIVLQPGFFNGEALVTDDFELGSQHSWRRMF